MKIIANPEARQGTLSEVVNAIVNSGTELGVISTKIDTPVRVRKMLDGDLCHETPVNAKTFRRAVKIITPPIKEKQA